MVLENQHGELKNIFLDSFESVLLAFHFSGYSELAHTKTIYQIFNTFLESSSYKVSSVEIVDYKEKIGHSKVTLIKNKTPIIFNCSIADGLILAHVNKIDMYCADDPWNALDEFDENEESEYDQEF